MNLAYFIDRLGKNRDVFEGLAECAGKGSWRPAPDKWSILKVVNLFDRRYTSVSDSPRLAGRHSPGRHRPRGW